MRRLREELNDAYPNFVCEKRIPFADGEVWMLCFEKYYFRVNSNNALTVLLTKKPGTQQVFLVADGGEDREAGWFGNAFSHLEPVARV